MRQFAGCEPLVGEIVALRTFRVDEAGLLLPLYSQEAWYDGPNTATCTPPTGDRFRGAHAVPADDCECGFYAYGSRDAARRSRQARYVQAVVSCWGGVLAGTQGVRAEHARIDAVWLHPHVPRWLRHRVAARYPSARLYGDVHAMLAEHPLSPLPCYEPAPAHHAAARVATVVAAAAVLSLGLVPLPTLRDVGPLWIGWLAVTAATAALTLWLLTGARGVGHWAAAAVVSGVLAWLLAPLFGLPGWLLRVPLLRGAGVAAAGALVTLRPRYFPVVRAPRERGMRAVHS